MHMSLSSNDTRELRIGGALVTGLVTYILWFATSLGIDDANSARKIYEEYSAEAKGRFDNRYVHNLDNAINKSWTLPETDRRDTSRLDICVTKQAENKNWVLEKGTFSLEGRKIEVDLPQLRNCFALEASKSVFTQHQLYEKIKPLFYAGYGVAVLGGLMTAFLTATGLGFMRPTRKSPQPAP